MQIEIKIDEKYKEPKIIVMTDKMTDEVNAIIKRLSDEQPQVIAGFREDVVEVLERLKSTVFLPNQVRCLPRQITASMRSA